MFFHKKISSDVLLLVLLVVRLRLDSDISLLSRSNIPEPESREVFLGSSSAYTQITFHSPYPHPKSVEFNEYEDAALLFNRLHYLNSVQRPYSVAYYASSPNVCNAASSSTDAGPEANGGESATGDTSLPMAAEETSPEMEPATSVRNQELSPEDMDLIEILWKQDIDLGVSRDAFDSRPYVEAEKLKDTKESVEEFVLPVDRKPCEENECVTNPSADLNYAVDSETGESMLDNLPGLSEESELLDNTTFSAFDLPLHEDDDLFSSDGILSEIAELIEDEPGSEFLFSQAEDDSWLPNIDDCWLQSTMLPLPAPGTPHQTPFTPLPQIPESLFENENPVLLLGSIPSQSNEHFTSVLGSLSLEENVANEAFYPVPGSLDTGSSVGCTLTESSATFPNDTEPFPTGSLFNNVYDSDFKELLYSNQTLTHPHNDLLTQNFFTDDDFQLVSSERNFGEDCFEISNDTDSLASIRVSSVSDCADWFDSCSETSSHHPESQEYSFANYIHTEGEGKSDFDQNAEHESSMPPKRHRNLKSRDSSNNTDFSGTSSEYSNENDPHYFLVKNEYSNTYEINGAKSARRKFDFSAGRLHGTIDNNILHHNHSYHLPLSSDDSHYKPVVRDKTKSSDEDDSYNKDEKRAKELKIPISIDDIINLNIDEYNERLSRYDLTDQQLNLIRDIRRRGKNKVAAQNCRKRKMDQISCLQQDLDALHKEKMQLKSKQNNLFQDKNSIEDKYAQLCQVVSQYTNCKSVETSNSHTVRPNPRTLPMTSDRQDDESDLGKGARTKRKIKK